MRIKSIELSGFKSFYNRTTIGFHSGINTVVGPNGCGKSNALDSIRWVLGEQNPRRLRAGGMEQIISNGSSDMKPLGMAEVILTITDAGVAGEGDSHDLQIRRRLYRSGESEYFINSNPARLKDVTELFLDTGTGARAYSIIDQGAVDQLVTVRPESRRSLIEEVAGIQKYKLRRRETSSRLESTRANLERVGDLLAEIARQMGSLDRQARQAQRYRKLSERAGALELRLLGTRRVDEERALGGLVQGRDAKTSTLAGHEGSLVTMRGEMQGKRGALERTMATGEALGAEIESIQTALGGKRSEIDVARSRILGIDGFTEKLGREIGHLTEQAVQLELELEAKRRTREGMQGELATRADAIAKRTGELGRVVSELEATQGELESTRSELLATLDTLSVLKASAEGNGREISELELRLERGRVELTAIEAQAAETGDGLDELEKALGRLDEERGRLESGRLALASRMEELELELNAAKEGVIALAARNAELSSRLAALTQIDKSYEWLPEGVRQYLLEAKGSSVLGTLADFITVDHGYERALEAALGPMLKWVVVKDRDAALAGIDALKTSPSGRCTFLPLDGMADPPRGGGMSPGLPLTPLIELTRVHTIEPRVVESLLSGFYVVEDLGQALSMRTRDGAAGACFVTRAGEVLHANGSVAGGRITDGVIERRREMVELEGEITGLTGERDALGPEVGRLEALCRETREEMERSAGSLVDLDISAAETKKDIANKRESMQGLTKRADLMRFDLGQTRALLEEKRTETAELSAQTEESGKARTGLEEAFRGLGEAARLKEEGRKGLEGSLTELRVAEAELRQRVNGLDGDTAELDRRLAATNAKIEAERGDTELKRVERDELHALIKAGERKTLALAEQLREKQADATQHRTLRDSTGRDINALDSSRERVSKEASDTRDELNALGIKISRAELVYEQTLARIAQLEAENPSPGEADAGDGSGFDAAHAEEELGRIKASLERFGPVNLLAPEEYAKLEERHDFLTTQVQDLNEAIESLHTAMRRIDRESQKRFLEAFEGISGKFKEVFSRLFKGGEGKLVLTDPEDLLETGVEMVVRPGGKKFQSVSLLSGGEKALSGIALVLSACLVRPAPFLLLDEIDAPLDDTNVLYFAGLLSEISARSQVLIVTHNKKTMQAGGTLIGVTSDVPGISRVVSVELNGTGGAPEPPRDDPRTQSSDNLL